MKVSTELKRLINLRFEELKSDMNKKYREEAKAIYEARIAEIEASPAWKGYMEASLRLYDYLAPDYHEVGLNNQRDKLLIKLTYEKKLENIEEMLAEYGIKL